MPSRIFSIEEANALIPELEVLLKKLDGKKEISERLHDMFLMDELLKEAETAKGKTGGPCHLEAEAQRLDGAILEIQAEIAKIRALGCIPRNLGRGWIDFPAQHNGQAVYFCWRRGEKTICFYSTGSLNGERLPIA